MILSATIQIREMSEQFELEAEKDSDYKKSTSTGRNQPIFGDDFKVESMQNPQQFLPRYQQDQIRERSFVQSCNSCCGLWCICMAYPFALLCCKCCCIYQLPTATAGIVQQFGKFSRMIRPGINMINPCTQQVHQVDMKIKMLTPGVNLCITKDNVKVTISSSIAYRVSNPILVNYILGAQLNHALVQATHSSIRNVVGQSLLDQVLANRAKIVEMSRKLILQKVPAGVIIQNVFIDDIIVPPQTIRILSATAKQRRVSQATIINSKADVESASLLKQAADLLDTKAAMQIRYLEMVTQLGKRGAKLLMPIGVDKKGFKQ